MVWSRGGSLNVQLWRVGSGGPCALGKEEGSGAPKACVSELNVPKCMHMASRVSACLMSHMDGPT